ncbi:MAG: hypothetical protein SPF17_04160 [Candidatus Mucispirillum faecigallinarum]|nr:hypothetical protein [Candidatus Mucispirillum faecigallinarum]
MKKNIIFFLLIILSLLLTSCRQNNSNTAENKAVESNIESVSNGTKSINQNTAENKKEKRVSPEKNPRLALEQTGFWNKKYYKLEYNPLYGYCYQHLFPAMDTSQEKDVISFHVKDLTLDPMVIFIVHKIAYNNDTYELSGTIDDKKHTLYIKVQDGNTINVRLGEYDINESYDLASGIAYSSFTNTYNHQEEPVFDLSVYDTCEEQDIAIISDISDKITDDKVQEQHGINVKTENGLDCWGKWASIDDKTHIYYELDKQNLLFKDYSEKIFSGGRVRTNTINDMTYKNGIFYFNFEDKELIGHMCIPIDNQTSMWVLDDVNLGIFEKYE